MFASSRSNSQGGGTAIYVRKTLDCIRRHDLESDLFESTFVEILSGDPISKKNYIIGEIYKPPNLNLDTFLDEIEKVLNELDKTPVTALIGGDYNINFWRLPSDKAALKFCNLVTAYNYHPLIVVIRYFCFCTFIFSGGFQGYSWPDHSHIL